MCQKEGHNRTIKNQVKLIKLSWVTAVAVFDKKKKMKMWNNFKTSEFQQTNFDDLLMI